MSKALPTSLRTRIDGRGGSLHRIIASPIVKRVLLFSLLFIYLFVCVVIEWKNPTKSLQIVPDFLRNKNRPTMTSLWQVHAAVVTLAIPLLTLLIEQSKAATPLANSASEALFNQVNIRSLMWMSFGSIIVGGISALFFDNVYVAVISLLSSAAMIFWIAHSYHVALALLGSAEKLLSSSIDLVRTRCTEMAAEVIEFRGMDAQLASIMNKRNFQKSEILELPLSKWVSVPAPATGRVIDLDCEKLIQILGRVSTENLDVSQNLDTSSIPANQIKSLRLWFCAFGTRVNSGKSLLAIEKQIDDKQISEELIESLSTCFTTDANRSLNDTVRSEFNALRTQALGSIERSTSRNLSDYLSVYEKLVAEKVSSPTFPQAAVARMLWPDIRRIARRVPLDEGADERDDFLEFLGRLLSKSDSIDSSTHQELLITFEQMFQMNLYKDNLESQTSFYLFETVLNHLRYELLFDELGTNTEIQVMHVIDFFMQCLRVSIRERNERFIILCLRYCKEIARYFKKSQSNNSSVDLEDLLNRASDRFWTYWLAIVSYIHMELKNDPTNSSLGDAIKEMLDLIPTSQLWDRYLQFVSDDGDDRPWIWWETERWRMQGIDSGSLGHLDDSAKVILAFLLFSFTPSRIENLITDIRAPDQSEHLIRGIIDALDDANKLRLKIAPRKQVTELDTVREKLEALRKNAANRLAQSEIKLPLIPEKVKEFHDTAHEVWQEYSALRDDSALMEPQTIRLEQFGLTSRVTRHYFTDNPRVFADPNDLARHMTSALCDGEIELVIKKLTHSGSQSKTNSVKLDDIERKVSESLAILRQRGLKPKIYILNSWETLRKLFPNEQISPSPDIVHKFNGVETRIEYRGKQPLCIVADLKNAVCINRWRFARTDDSEEFSDDRMLKSTVRSISRYEADKLVNDNLDFLKSSDGLEKTHEQAVSDLMNSVVVSIHSKIEIELSDSSAVEFFWIEESL